MAAQIWLTVGVGGFAGTETDGLSADNALSDVISRSAATMPSCLSQYTLLPFPVMRQHIA